MSDCLYFATVVFLLVGLSSSAFAQASGRAGAGMSERDKAGLRGPVKTVVEEQTVFPADGQSFSSTTVTEYTSDGKILQRRRENPDGPAWMTSYTYAEDGRLLKISSGNSGSSPTAEESYTYDEGKRLIGSKSGDREAVRYQYDESGRKTMTQSYSPDPLPPSVGYAPYWEGTDLGFAPIPGGKLVTSYNDHEVATGAKLYDAQGDLVGHIVRQFDAQGRITSEQQITDTPELLVPEDLRSQLNAEQLKGVGAFIAGGLLDRGITYSYDDRGRMTAVRKTGGAFGDQATTTTYNEHGDVATESTTEAMNPQAGREYSITDAGKMILSGEADSVPPPSTYEARYTYEYDLHGNWNEQTKVIRSTPDAPFTPASTLRRKLTYY